MADILLGNVKGPQGNTGATGSQGPRGDAATITVGTVSTTAYGNTAQVINSGTEQDAVLDFVIPQGKPGEQTTRMGALTLDTITAQSADFPIPAVGETGSTVFGKIIKFFNSTISALNSKLNISDVVNNLTSTSTTQPLSAAQGKALNDALASTNEDVATLDSKRTWTHTNYAEFTGQTNVSLPTSTDYKDLYIYIKGNSGYYSLYIPRAVYEAVPNTQSFYLNGWYYSTSQNSYGFVTKNSNSSIKIATLFENGQNVSASVKGLIFYR